MTTTVPEPVESLLTSEPLMAHVATCVDDRPHVAPVWYRYEDDVIELVTSGRKLDNLRENPRVGLSIQKAIDGQAQWMVSLLGTATVVDDQAAFETANNRINEKYDADEDAYEENMLVRISIGSVTHRTY